MRIVEVLVKKVTEDGDEKSDALLSILDHLVHKADDSTEHGESKISFATIIQFMRNLRQPIDFDEFKQIYDMNPAISNLVRNFDDEFMKYCQIHKKKLDCAITTKRLRRRNLTSLTKLFVFVWFPVV